MLAAILRELLGLFVDDGALALLIFAVAVAAGASAILLPGQSWLAGVILLLGCLAALFASVMFAGRR